MIDHEAWENAFSPTKREHRFERKMAIKHDRSQYKITDRPKEKACCIPDHAQKGVVLCVRPGAVEVSIDGHVYACSIRGSLRQWLLRDANVVVAGDNVFVELDGKEGRICHVAPRYSALCRQDHLHRIKKQIIAANVDYICITIAIQEPLFKLALVDRYIIASRKMGLKPCVIMNKVDLRNEWPNLYATALQASCMYRELQIPSFCVSATTGESIDDLKNVLRDHKSVFAGQSGTGKTQLVNTLTGLSLKTSAVRAAGKGSHTTTNAQLVTLPFGGWCVDTPGVRSFGIWDLQVSDIQNGFPEIVHEAQYCSFQNCSHTSEPECAVVKAVQDGKIFPLRVQSYCSLMSSLRNGLGSADKNF